MASKKKKENKGAAMVRAEEAHAVNAAKHPSALDRRDHGGEPVLLSKKEELLLMEAVRRGESSQRKNQDTMLDFGQWLLDSVFDGDTTAALDPKSHNPIWLELVRRAGGPTLHVSTRFLYVALRIAAYDKRITDESWRLLDVGRKELLLPLADVKALREAARHVTKFDLTQRMVQSYVTGQLGRQGESREVRWTAPQMQKQLEKLHMMLEERAPLQRLREIASGLSEEQRQSLLGQARELQKTLAVVARELRK